MSSLLAVGAASTSNSRRAAQSTSNSRRNNNNRGQHLKLEKARISQKLQKQKVAERRRELLWIAKSIYEDWSTREYAEDGGCTSSSCGGLDEALLQPFIERTFETMIMDASGPNQYSFASLVANDAMMNGHGSGDGSSYKSYPSRKNDTMKMMRETQAIEFANLVARDAVNVHGCNDYPNNSSSSSRTKNTTTMRQRQSRQKLELNEHALQMARSAAMECNQYYNDCDEGTFSLEALLCALDSYCEYVVHQSMVEKTFRKYNRAGDGKLTRSELLSALQDRERKANRAVKSVITLLLISPHDMDIIMEEATACRRRRTSKRSSSRSTRSSITRSELLPAIEIWEQLAQEKLHRKQMSTCGISVGCGCGLSGSCWRPIASWIGKRYRRIIMRMRR